MDDHVVITLLRHGLTLENERSAYIGWTDSSLSEQGRTILQKVKKQWVSCHPLDGNTFTFLCKTLIQPEHVFSSDLQRCLETATILFPTYPIQTSAELREMNFGAWEGKTYSELKDIPTYREWLDHPLTKRPDRGESFQQFSERIESGFSKIKQQIIASASRSAVIVTHGGVIRYLLTTYTSSAKHFFDWDVPHGGGYQLIWSMESLRRGETCMSLQEVPSMAKRNG